MSTAEVLRPSWNPVSMKVVKLSIWSLQLRLEREPAGMLECFHSPCLLFFQGSIFRRVYSTTKKWYSSVAFCAVFWSARFEDTNDFCSYKFLREGAGFKCIRKEIIKSSCSTGTSVCEFNQTLGCYWLWWSSALVQYLRDKKALRRDSSGMLILR